MSKQVAECLLMTHTTFSSDVWTWQKQGIGFFSGFSFDLTPEIRSWLEDNVGHAPTDWWWDHFTDEGETSIVFVDPRAAVLFKLTWL